MITCQMLVHGLLINCDEEITVCWNDEEIKSNDEPEDYSFWVYWDCQNHGSELLSQPSQTQGSQTKPPFQAQ